MLFLGTYQEPAGSCFNYIRALRPTQHGSRVLWKMKRVAKIPEAAIVEILETESSVDADYVALLTKATGYVPA